MHFLKSRTTTVVAATLILIGGANVATYAATGGHFLLGESNSAGRTTGLTNTGTGAVLALKGSTSSPPLTVNSKRVVTNLNADMVDGKHASSLQSKIPALVWHPLALGSGVAGDCYTDVPSYAVQLGIAYFKGDLCSVSQFQNVFTVPASILPHRAGGTIYLTVDECNARTARISISTSTGKAYIETDPTDNSAPLSSTCFASLEGVSYPIH